MDGAPRRRQGAPNRLTTAGSTLEGAMLRLADDLEAEGEYRAAERIRAELVLGGLEGA